MNHPPEVGVVQKNPKRPVLFVIFGGVAFGVFLFVTRPWSPWSPWKLNQLFWESRRVENFRHMDRFFPAHVMHRSSWPRRMQATLVPLPLPRTYAFEGKEQSTESFLERTVTTGVLVIRDGVVIHEEYRRGADETSMLTSWSMVKTVVGTLLGIAVKEGRVGSLDDRVERYIPELHGEAFGAATVRDLLRMASGVRFDETYSNRLADIHQIFYRTFLFGQAIDTAAARYPAENPPGTHFHYKSVDTQILSWVIRRATGRSLAEYAQEKLWEPLGMEHDAFWNTDFHGNELGYCCLNASLRDYGKLGQLLLDGGRVNGVGLLPTGWVRESTRRSESWLAAGHGYPERGYGYHLWIPRDANGEYFANGVWGQTIFVDEPHRVVIVKTSVDPEFKAHTPEMIAFMRGVVRSMANAPVSEGSAAGRGAP